MIPRCGININFGMTTVEGELCPEYITKVHPYDLASLVPNVVRMALQNCKGPIKLF